MDENRFWDMIHEADSKAGGDMDKKCKLITSAIARLTKQDAIAFSHMFDRMMDRAYSWELWAAAYIINGGCSDDSFSDFRSSLISRGQLALEQALTDPESLVEDDFDEDVWFYESFQYAVHDGVKASAGFVPDRETPHPNEPSGEAWEEDEVNVLFPKLAEKYA
jgi:hypothetical protein